MSGAAVAGWDARTGDPGFVKRMHAVQARFETGDAAPDDKLLDEAEKAVASLLPFVAQEAAKPDPASKAKAALARSVVWRLQEVLQPALGQARLIEARLYDPAEIDAEADEAAAQLAASLAASEPAARQAAFGAPWPAQALALVLHHVPPERRTGVAADIVQGAGAARAELPELCAAAAGLSAAKAETAAGVLDPSSVFSALSHAVAATGPTAAYAQAVAAEADLVGALMSHAAPSELTRVASGLHDAVLLRFGHEDALSAVAFHVTLRVLAPVLSAERQQALGNAVQAAGGPARTALDRYAGMLVKAGYAADAAAAGDEDPDDLIVQRGAALEDMDTLAAAFATPSPADPLGTCPALPITILGQAILAARHGRDIDFAWSALEEMRRTAPEDYETVLLDERSQVLDAIPLPG